MNKKELIQACANKTGVSPEETLIHMDAFLETITETLVSGEKVVIKGFGKFERKNYNGRTGRNPSRPDEMYSIPSRYVAVFKEGKTLKRAINK